MMVFMSLVFIMIGLFCDLLGREDSDVFRYWSVVVLLISFVCCH